MSVKRPRDPVAAARAAGASLVRIGAVIEQDNRVLLVAYGGDGFIEETWQPPTVFAFHGETHHDALRRGLPAYVEFTTMTIGEYLGHYDHPLSRHDELVRLLYFRVTIDDHNAACPRATRRHRWCRLHDLPANTEPPPRHLTELLVQATGPEPPSVEPLRTHARGLYAAEAAVELLINHAVWLRRTAFIDNFLNHVEDSDTPMAYINWADAITALDAGQLPCSGGEGRILRLAASIGDGTPVDLRDALTGLDRCNIGLLIQTVQHANGRRP